MHRHSPPVHLGGYFPTHYRTKSEDIDAHSGAKSNRDIIDTKYLHLSNLVSSLFSFFF